MRLTEMPDHRLERPAAPAPSAETTEYFIPPGVLEPDRPDSDAFVRAWYSKHLRVMGEPSLSCGRTPEAEIYRFTLNTDRRKACAFGFAPRVRGAGGLA